MKTIIAGGRDHYLTLDEFDRIDAIHTQTPITEVVCGCATGVDECGKAWAKSNVIPVKPMPADWDDITVPGALIRRHPKTGKLYNAKAGPMRNSDMAAYAKTCSEGGACVLFPGGTGTNDMAKKARAAGLRVYDFREAK